jgi:hypothetical protein
VANNDTYILDASPGTLSLSNYQYVPGVGIRLTFNTSANNGVKYLSVEASYDYGGSWEYLSEHFPVTGNSTIFLDDGSWNGKSPLDYLTVHRATWKEEKQIFVDGVLVSSMSNLGE